MPANGEFGKQADPESRMAALHAIAPMIRAFTD
jgi:hypothetical protein